MEEIFTYLEEHRQSLLSIFGQIISGRSLELWINPKLSEDDIDKAACIDTVMTHKYRDGIVDFPCFRTKRVSTKDHKLSEELYRIILCEEAVRNGVLVRNGTKYCPAGRLEEIEEPTKYGRYLTT